MIYLYCSDCDLKFRKSSPSETKCIRCGSGNLMEYDVPKSNLSDIDDTVEEMLREKYCSTAKI